MNVYYPPTPLTILAIGVLQQLRSHSWSVLFGQELDGIPVVSGFCCQPDGKTHPFMVQGRGA